MTLTPTCGSVLLSWSGRDGLAGRQSTREPRAGLVLLPVSGLPRLLDRLGGGADLLGVYLVGVPAAAHADHRRIICRSSYRAISVCATARASARRCRAWPAARYCACRAFTSAWCSALSDSLGADVSALMSS